MKGYSACFPIFFEFHRYFFFFFFNEIKGILRLKKNCKDRRVLLKAELLSVFYPSSTFTFFKDVATEKETPEARQEERL